METIRTRPIFMVQLMDGPVLPGYALTQRP